MPRPAPSKGKGKGPREIHGVLKHVDAAAGTITVSARIKGQDAELTYSLTKQVLSAVAGGLKSGSGVQLRLSDDRRMVIEIRPVNGRGEKGGKENR